MERAEWIADALSVMIRQMVDKPDDVRVGVMISDGGTVILTVRTAPDETGKVIGKQGRNAGALRVLLDAVGAKHGAKIVMEIAEHDIARKRRRTRSGSHVVE